MTAYKPFDAHEESLYLKGLEASRVHHANLNPTKLAALPPYRHPDPDVNGIARNLKFAAEVPPKLLAGLNEDERAIVEAGWLDGTGLGTDGFNRSAFEGTKVRP